MYAVSCRKSRASSGCEIELKVEQTGGPAPRISERYSPPAAHQSVRWINFTEQEARRLYTYIDSTGPTRLPNRTQVVRLASEDGTITTLVLDANVCLDLTGLGRQRPRTREQEEARCLVQQVAESGVDVLPGFGLAELSLKRTRRCRLTGCAGS
jgi:hypothetical protein